MYKVIGADDRQYGPITADQVRQWIAEHRLGRQSHVQAEGTTEWKPLSEFPEFADALAAHTGAEPPPPPPPFPAGAAPAAAAGGVFDGDYDLDIGGCISRGYELFKNNFSPLFLGALLYWLVEGALAGLGAVPFVGPLFSILNLFVAGPLMGGLYFLYLKVLRGQPASPGDVFAGFQTAWVQLFLAQLVSGLLAGLCLIPAFIVGAASIVPAIMHNQPPAPGMLILAGAIVLVCLIPMIFLTINWMFALALVIDQRMDFWPAMQLSWKQVNRHWWPVFGLVILAGLINVVGMLCCCVGVLFTMPVVIGALMYAYETMFSEPRRPNA